VVVGGGELGVGRHADEDDGFGVESLGLVNGDVADAVRAVLFLCILAEVAVEEDAAVAEGAVGDIGLGVEDEDVGGIAEAGFLPAGEDGFDEFARAAAGIAVDFRFGAFGEVVAVAERVDHASVVGLK
jgi:hypothetical protein